MALKRTLLLVHWIYLKVKQILRFDTSKTPYFPECFCDLLIKGENCTVHFSDWRSEIFLKSMKEEK